MAEAIGTIIPLICGVLILTILFPQEKTKKGRYIALIAGIFCLLVFVMLVLYHFFAV